ncbi:hypothetical protein [Isoptericola sp. NPDC055881]
MTQHDPTTDNPGAARSTVRYRGRHLPMVAVVVAATIATALAYSGMVLFGLEVAGMSPAEAYALAGFLEVSLVAVALMARNAALEGRPYGVLLTLTWILSGTSGMFAALHEIAVPDASTPYMVAFRFVPPLVAALMWHLALVGERHLVTGHTLDERRREHRVHQYVTALELWRDARLDSTGNRGGMRKVRSAHHRQRAARDAALKLLTVEDFERRMQVWVERLEAAERHGNRLDLIGASSVNRGVVRPSGAPGPSGQPAVTAGPSLPSLASLVAAPEPVVTTTVTGADDPFADEFRSALTGSTPVVTADGDLEGTAGDDAGRTADDAPEEAEWFDDLEEQLAADATAPEPDDGAQREAQAAAEAGLPGTGEPLPETGHTRRVEVFDLLQETDPALGDALAQRSAFLTAHGTSTPQDAEAAVAEAAAAGDGDGPVSDRDRHIVALAGDGLSHREIAERVEVFPSTVGRVVKRYVPA